MRTPEQLRNLLQRHAGGPVPFTLTRNRVSMLSVRFDFLGKPRIRLNQAFLSAPDAVIVALGHYLQTKSRSSWKRVCEFVSSREPDPTTVRPVVARAGGRVYDLAVIRDRINSLHFKGTLECRIGWAKPGQRHRHARTRTLRYGTYNKALNLIRINPVLDDERVPAEFMDYIVFHEMLHAAVPSQRGNTRWNHHHTSYRKLESQYPDHAKMQKLAAHLVTVLG